MRKAPAALLLLLMTAQPAAADQAIITYNSGKTQSVRLDEPVGNIREIRYLSDERGEQHSPPTISLEKGKQPLTPGQEQKKKLPRVEWGEPVLTE